MNKGSKYYSLHLFLRQHDADELTLTFDEIEEMIGQKLPKSARTGRPWWSNRGSGAVQAAAWMGAGYHAEDVDLDAGAVTFRKPTLEYNLQWRNGEIVWDGGLIKTVRNDLGMTQTELADELSIRQQTVSEWETGMYKPTRAMSKLLTIVVERAGVFFGEEKPKEK